MVTPLLVKQLPVSEARKGDNGTGMHVHQSIWKGDTLFSGQICWIIRWLKFYIGGILKHVKKSMHFLTQTTNSYKGYYLSKHQF